MELEDCRSDADDITFNYKLVMNETRKLHPSKYSTAEEDNKMMLRINIFSTLLHKNIITLTEIQFALKIIQKLHCLQQEENYFMFASSTDLLFIFVSCLVISHKYLIDKSLGNDFFASSFSLSPLVLGECVFFCLSKLNYNLVL
jgi:hypothetical protein